MCLVWTLQLNETLISKLKEAAFELCMTPIFWNQRFYFLYYGPWMSGAEWTVSSQNLTTLCLLNLPELDEKGWLVFNCPDKYCLASVTFLDDIGWGFKLAFKDH